VKFLLDENLSHRHAARLRANGHDAVAVVEESLAGASDSAVRSAAAKSGRVLLTLDADFGNIVRYPPKGTPASSGCVSIRQAKPRSSKLSIAV
jgi:predicted nuclease of predicted toxin-antitoxin system